jgi:hypothetical protein
MRGLGKGEGRPEVGAGGGAVPSYRWHGILFGSRLADGKFLLSVANDIRRPSLN